MQTTTTHTHPAPVDFPADLSPALDALAWGMDPGSSWIDGYYAWHAGGPFDYSPTETARIRLAWDGLAASMAGYMGDSNV